MVVAKANVSLQQNGKGGRDSTGAERRGDGTGRHSRQLYVKAGRQMGKSVPGKKYGNGSRVSNVSYGGTVNFDKRQSHNGGEGQNSSGGHGRGKKGRENL